MTCTGNCNQGRECTCQENKMVERLRIDHEGRIFWNQREVESDAEFRAAMLDLSNVLVVNQELQAERDKWKHEFECAYKRSVDEAQRLQADLKFSEDTCATLHKYVAKLEGENTRFKRCIILIWEHDVECLRCGQFFYRTIFASELVPCIPR